MARSLLLAKVLVCAELSWLCWLVLVVGKRDQDTAVRMETMSSVDSSCYAGSLWKNRALDSFCLSVIVSRSCPVCLSLTASFFLPQPLDLICLSLPLTLIYWAVLLQDCLWRYWVLENAKLHHLQDIPLQLSKSIQEIKWHSICGRKLSTVIKADVFPAVILPLFLANWPHLILKLLSRPLFVITANAQAIKHQ